MKMTSMRDGRRRQSAASAAAQVVGMARAREVAEVAGEAGGRRLARGEEEDMLASRWCAWQGPIQVQVFKGAGVMRARKQWRHAVVLVVENMSAAKGGQVAGGGVHKVTGRQCSLLPFCPLGKARLNEGEVGCSLQCFRRLW